MTVDDKYITFIRMKRMIYLLLMIGLAAAEMDLLLARPESIKIFMSEKIVMINDEINIIISETTKMYIRRIMAMWKARDPSSAKRSWTEKGLLYLETFMTDAQEKIFEVQDILLGSLLDRVLSKIVEYNYLDNSERSRRSIKNVVDFRDLPSKNIRELNILKNFYANTNKRELLNLFKIKAAALGEDFDLEEENNKNTINILVTKSNTLFDNFIKLQVDISAFDRANRVSERNNGEDETNTESWNNYELDRVLTGTEATTTQTTTATEENEDGQNNPDEEETVDNEEIFKKNWNDVQEILNAPDAADEEIGKIVEKLIIKSRIELLDTAFDLISIMVRRLVREITLIKTGEHSSLTTLPDKNLYIVKIIENDKAKIYQRPINDAKVLTPVPVCEEDCVELNAQNLFEIDRSTFRCKNEKKLNDNAVYCENLEEDNCRNSKTISNKCAFRQAVKIKGIEIINDDLVIDGVTYGKFFMNSEERNTFIRSVKSTWQPSTGPLQYMLNRDDVTIYIIIMHVLFVLKLSYDIGRKARKWIKKYREERTNIEEEVDKTKKEEMKQYIRAVVQEEAKKGAQMVRKITEPLNNCTELTITE